MASSNGRGSTRGDSTERGEETVDCFVAFKELVEKSQAKGLSSREALERIGARLDAYKSQNPDEKEGASWARLLVNKTLREGREEEFVEALKTEEAFTEYSARAAGQIKDQYEQNARAIGIEPDQLSLPPDVLLEILVSKMHPDRQADVRPIVEMMAKEEGGAETFLDRAIELGGLEPVLVELQEHAMGDRRPEAQAVNRPRQRTTALIAKMAAVGAEWVRREQANGWTVEELHRQIWDDIVQGHPAKVGDTQAQTYQERRAYYWFDCFSVLWFMSGLPRIEVGQRLAASFAVSRVPPEVLPDVRMPWPAFVVDIPENLRPSERSPAIVLCSQHGVLEGARYTIDAIGGEDGAESLSLREIKGLKDIAAAAESKQKESEGGPTPFQRVLCRLVLGALMEMNEHRPTPKTEPRPRKKGADRGLPRCTMVRLTRDVKVDAREMVRAYLRGEYKARGPITVQTFVEGHWKMQVCGKGRADRVRIHIEPYWRGPDDAPIAIKNHILSRKTPKGTAPTST